MSTIEHVLIVDDERLLREFLAETLKRQGFEVYLAENTEGALKVLKDKSIDLVLTDMKMGKMSGLDLIREAKQLYPHVMFIVMTAYGSIENAVQAMRLGAFDYLVKPFSLEAIETTLEKAKTYQALVRENSFLKEERSPTKDIDQALFVSPAMKSVYEEINKASQTQASIFLTGESGVGKEVIASLIHQLSPRKDKPFIKINCAAVPDTLLEAELFGYEKGAFTGAHAKKPGRFELANTGTLLLDEITEIPIHMQTKLLRVIQEREVERLGGVKPIKIDVRLISTSNRPLKEALAQGILREDLYFRLNVIPIHIPPLRERKEDIIPLAESLMRHSCKENHLPIKKLSADAKNALLEYRWPGNVRELGNVMERSSIVSTQNEITAEDLRLEEMPPVLTLQELAKQKPIERRLERESKKKE